MFKILFLAANPRETTRLRLDEESRAIDQAIRASEFRDQFEIRAHWAVRVSDLQELLLRHSPDIVHFCGHGTISNELILQDSSGASHPVSVDALQKLFTVHKDNIRCVVLNACYSQPQAEAIANNIDCVIGMSNNLSDTAAISFASAFYLGLGYGSTVQKAYDMGCLQMKLDNVEECDVPKLLSLKNDPRRITFKVNQRERTRNHYDDHVVDHEKTVASHLDLGLSYLDRRMYSRAVESLNEAYSIDCQNANIPYYIALALIGGRMPRALRESTIRTIEEHIDAAIRLDSSRSHFYYLSAIINFDFYVGNGYITSIEEVKSLLEAAAQLEPEVQEIERLRHHVALPENSWIVGFLPDRW